jgi:hypothetical protein
MTGRERRTVRRAWAVFAAGCAGWLALAPAHLAAHEGHVHETLSFQRPEAWALAYFTSATLLAGLEPPQPRSPWSVSFGAEAGLLTPVSRANRFVGFDGTKPEDLNKAPFFVRPRVTVGLPGGFALTLAVPPPIRAFGVTPRLVALALERPVYRSDRWTVGVRGYGQTGTVKGAYTCPSSVLAFTPGSPQNLYGCEATSSDTATLRYAGGEVSVGHAGIGRRKLSPHAAVGLNYMSTAFQVNAFTFGFQDRTHYSSHGFTVSGSAGLTYPLGRRLNASVDVFYTPLVAQRPTGRALDPFLNARALLTYRLR